MLIIRNELPFSNVNVSNKQQFISETNGIYVPSNKKYSKRGIFNF